MKEFNYTKLKNRHWDFEILGYIAQIHEAKGRQDLYLKQKPEQLTELVEIAKVQSTEASNAIEGIRTTNTRLKQLVRDMTAPRNRDEKEIAGYRDALNIIHENFESIPITPNFILQLHKILLSHVGTGMDGKYKNVQNYISATTADGKAYTLFTPLSPFETPLAMESLCEEFNRALGSADVDPLILIPIFIHDFLCIHPFLDGNGRMSRLLTTLLLYRCGYEVGRFISLEAKIAEHKDLYYDALQASGDGWHENNDDPLPFIKYLLGTILSAYRDFDERMKIVSEKVPAKEMVLKAVGCKIGKFTKQEIKELCSTLSISSIETALRELIREGYIERKGSGRSIYYVRLKY